MSPSTTTNSKRVQKSTQTAGLGFRLTQRDSGIIQRVYEYRALHSLQIQALFFASAHTRAQCLLRLRHLATNGFLHRQEQFTLLSEGNKPRVFWLDRNGAHYLADMLGIELSELDWRPREWEVGSQFVPHLLKTNDVRIALTLAAKKHGFTIQNWLDERELRRHQREDTIEITGARGGTQKAAAIADGHFELVTDRRAYHLSLETDLRTVTGTASSGAQNGRDWARRIQVILAYYHSGKYEARYGTTSMRWLTVTTGEKRLENLKHITEQFGKTRFWFTTFERLGRGDSLVDPVWSVAGRVGVYPLID